MLGLRAVGVGGMPAGGLSSPPAHGVVGGMEGLSLVCESPRANRKTSGGGSGGGGGGGLMWSAEGGRQLETWRVSFRRYARVVCKKRKDRVRGARGHRWC